MILLSTGTLFAAVAFNSIALLHQHVMLNSMKQLYPSQLEAQRAISRQVHSYPLWTSGVIDVEKWPRFVLKMAERYEIDISPSARQWRKKKGECTALLIAAELPKKEYEEKIRWVLMVSESGTGAVKEKEKLSDARNTRITWGDYVLMYMTRPREWGGGSRWTWCMSPQLERQESNYLTATAQAAAISNQPKRLNDFVHGSLLKRPMHSGIRTQVAKMLRRAQKVWAKHSHGKPWPSVDPANLPHLGEYRKSESFVIQEDSERMAEAL